MPGFAAFKGTILLSAAMLLSGAANRTAPLPVAPDDATERVAAALAQGDGGKTPALRQRAANALAALGARPADASVIDVVKLWSRTDHRGSSARRVYRGRILGPIYRQGSVSPHQAAITEQLFLGGQPASLSVSPTRGGQLDLVVREMGGQAVCNAVVRQPAATCRWSPTYSARYQIEIRNSGASPSRYFLAMD